MNSIEATEAIVADWARAINAKAGSSEGDGDYHEKWMAAFHEVVPSGRDLWLWLADNATWAAAPAKGPWGTTDPVEEEARKALWGPIERVEMLLGIFVYE